MSLSHISRFVLWGAIGFILGVGLMSFFNIDINLFIFYIGTISIICIIVFYRKAWIWCFIFSSSLFAFGLIMMNSSLMQINNLENNLGDVVYGQARVVDEVKQKDWNSIVVLEYDTNITVIIKDEKYTQLIWGSVVDLKCITSFPESYDDFDYQKYLFLKGVDYVCDTFEYELTGFESSALSKLSLFRNKLENIVNVIIPAPQSALANGLLFGGDDRLSDDIQDKFAQTGMTHIVAVSGYNVSIIAAVVMSFLIFVGINRHWSVILAIISIIFFVAIIGFPSSGVRAAIMGIMVLVAAAHGRVSNAWSAIFFTGAIMIALNPLLLRYDVGFQLSFLATLGIISVYPIFEKYFVSKDKAFGILDILLLTISAQFFVLPIIAYHFETISVLSLLANVLILPIIPITMLLVFLMIIASFIFYPIALFLGWLAYFLLSYEMFVIDYLADISWNSIHIESVGLMWFTLYYMVAIGIIFFLNRK